MLLTADAALVGEAGTGLGGWLAPAAEEGQPGTGRGPLPPGTRQAAVAREGVVTDWLVPVYFHAVLGG